MTEEMRIAQRKKLIELLESAESAVYWDSGDKCFVEKIADHLIANGVTLNVTDINVGDKVFAIYCVEKYQMRCGNTRRRNWQIDTAKSLRMHKKYSEVEVREKTCTKTDINQLGRTVFKTREDAERALDC